MIKNQWVKWEPATNISTQYEFYSLLEDVNNHELVIELIAVQSSYQKVKLAITWVMYFQRTAASFTDNKLEEKWTFFEVKNSIFLENLSKGSAGLYPANDLSHFVIVTQNFVIEIAVLQFSNDSLRIEIEV